jgi:hypothetical protein
MILTIEINFKLINLQVVYLEIQEYLGKIGCFVKNMTKQLIFKE